MGQPQRSRDRTIQRLRALEPGPCASGAGALHLFGSPARDQASFGGGIDLFTLREAQAVSRFVAERPVRQDP